MNYLAHLVIAQRSGTSLIGNFLGDFVKGKIEDIDLAREIKVGIAMHRKVDTYTDNHPVVKLSKQRISTNRRRFAGIIIDMAFDHLLATNWSAYCEQPIEQFVSEFYQQLEQNKSHLPATSLNIVPHMIAGNWLINYQSIDGIAFGINGISERYRRRFGRQNQLYGGAIEIEQNLANLTTDFNQFFPELLSYAESLKVGQLLA